MLLSAGGISSTQISGVVSYGMCLLISLVALARYRKSGRWESWLAGVAVAQLVLLLDMLFNWRWMLHEFFMRNAQEHGLYDLRRSPQLTVVIVLFVALVMAVWWIWKRFGSRPGAALAIAGTLFSVGLCGAEAVSYHYLDAVFHAMIGGVMLIGGLWMGLALITICGILFDSQKVNMS